MKPTGNDVIVKNGYSISSMLGCCAESLVTAFPPLPKPLPLPLLSVRLLPFGGVILLTSESDDLRTCVWGEMTLTGDVAHLMIWEGGEEGVADSSGRGELKGKLNADWLLETIGGAEGGGDMETDFLTGVWGGVIVK